MARANDRDELAELGSLLDVLRARNVIKYVKGPDGSVEILMGPALPPKNGKAEEKDPRAAKRAHYHNLLGIVKTDEELDLLP